jgi:parvulin-like peptidyl-prolyl isomerase
LKRVVSGCCITALLLAGCADNPSPQPAPAVQNEVGTKTSVPAAPSTNPLDQPVAHLNGKPFSLRQLMGPLMESHGLTVLVNLLQLEQARDDAARAGITVTDADLQTERSNTLNGMFKDASDQLLGEIDQAETRNNTAEANRLRAQLARDQTSLLDQFLNQQHISPAEFDIILRINTYLRKIAEPAINARINEESIRTAFNQLYGETVQIRVIKLANQIDVAKAQRRLAAGEKFEDVAQDMSTDRESAELGGEVPRFSRQAPGFTQNFKDVAFSLQPGQISDPVESASAFYLIKMDNRFAPRAVKYETVHDSVRQQLFSAAVKSAVKQLREDLARRVLQGVKIDDPVLSEQFNERVENREARAKDRQKIRDDMDRQRALATAPTTAPAAAPLPAPTAPSAAPAVPAAGPTAPASATRPATGQ